MQNGAWVNPLKVPLSLLITITEVSGESLPRDVLSVALVNEMFQNAVGIDPLDVEIINSQDVFVELPEEYLAGNVAEAIQGEGHWQDHDIFVHCIVATKDSCTSIQREREQMRASNQDLAEAKLQLERERTKMLAEIQQSQQELAQEKSRIQFEFVDYRTQMSEMRRQVNEQLILLETVWKNVEEQTRTRHLSGGCTERYALINKPPIFPPFSGTEPTPKDECGIETLLFQVRGA